MYDVIIIGGGPAGMTAAVYAARKVLSLVMISPDIGGQATWASEIENYLGCPYVSGFDLAMKFEKHIKSFNVNRLDDKVAAMEIRGPTFWVKTEGGQEIEGRSVVISSGRSARNLGVPGEEEYKGRGVTYCATCDAPLYGGKEVAVVGGGNAGLDAAIQLSKIAKQVYVIESDATLNGDPKYVSNLQTAENVKVLTGTEIVEIHGNRVVESVTLNDCRTGKQWDMPIDGIFVEIGSMPNCGFLPPDVAVNKHGEIIVDCACRTNVEGVYAAGDVTDILYKQIIIAAGEGAKALLSADDFLIRHYPDLCCRTREEAPAEGTKALSEMFRPVLR